MNLRKNKKVYRRTKYIDDYKFKDKDGNMMIPSELADALSVDDKTSLIALLDATRDMIEQLDMRDKIILKRVCVDGKTQCEVAEELEISQSYVSRLLKRIRASINRKVQKDKKDWGEVM